MKKYFNNYLVIGDINFIKIILVLFFISSACIYSHFFGPPTGLTSKAWNLLIIFISTIISVMLKPMPNGVIALIAMTACVLTKTLETKEVLTSFSNTVVWLIILSFFIALGIKVTGLGKRITYFLISVIGKNNLGLAYGLVLSEFILSPLIPSSAARGIGIMFPIVDSILMDQNKKGVKKRFSAFIVKVCFQTNLITSAMFITSFVGNPLIVKWLSAEQINITWLEWATIMIVPGVINLLIMPLVVYFTYRPQLTNNSAVQTAKNALKTMGKITKKEIMMILSFCIILGLWISIKKGQIDPVSKTIITEGLLDTTLVAFIGVCIMLLSGIIKWKDCLKESAAWEMMFWFAPLLMMSGFLVKMDVHMWVVDHLKVYTENIDCRISLVAILLFYFYIHYFFSSVTAKISALYLAMFPLLVSCGTPPLVAGMGLAVTASLGGSLTNFGTGTAPVYFGMGYISIAEWFKNGFIFSTINLIIWAIVCYFWWQYLDLYPS